MKLRLPAVLLTVASILLAACAGGTNADAPPAAAPAGSAAALVDSLRSAGLEVQDAGTVEQPFFAVPAHVYVVDGRDLQLYEFANATDAERAAAQVAPTGSPIGTAMVTWMDAPHFFRKDRLVANYVGSSEKVLTELRRLLGPQFAGR